MTNTKKSLIPIDEGNFCGTLGYGYTNKKEFARDHKETTGEPLSREDYKDLQIVKVMKCEKNGEDYYCWADKCPHCGSDNNGILSILDLH
ncbi:hypothetical protein KAR28_04460 [Candidatus Parcubacteria bacterium]|nr:hypothetical protein [Candidatus Parcubacteria bacterium]